MDQLTRSNFVDIITYKGQFPVFYFDVSKQSERVSQSVVDIKISDRRREEDECNILVCKYRPDQYHSRR